MLEKIELNKTYKGNDGVLRKVIFVNEKIVCYCFGGSQEDIDDECYSTTMSVSAFKELSNDFKPEPKTKKVKMLCWFDGCDLVWRLNGNFVPDTWERVASEDKIIEVQE